MATIRSHPSDPTNPNSGWQEWEFNEAVEFGPGTLPVTTTCDVELLLPAGAGYQGVTVWAWPAEVWTMISPTHVRLLIQLPGIGIVTALTLLAAIGDIARFPAPGKLVGYAGLGARVHDSGLSHRSGRITKAGRRDIRAVMVEAAQTAANTHPHWQAELARLEPRLGRNKAIVAIARKLLVAVWHILTEGCADRFAEPERVARKLARYAYTVGRENRAAGQTVGEFVREQLDCLGLGADLDAIRWGQRAIPMPPASLSTAED